MILLPVFPQTEQEEELLWHRMRQTSLIEEQIGRIKANDLVVSTNQHAVHALAQKQNILSILTEKPTLPDFPWLPPGTATSLRLLIQKYPQILTDCCTIVNYRFAPLSAALISSLGQQFQQSQTQLILGILPIEQEHPCQFETFYSITRVDNIIINDNSALPVILKKYNHIPPLFDPNGTLNLFHFSRAQVPFYDFSQPTQKTDTSPPGMPVTISYLAGTQDQTQHNLTHFTRHQDPQNDHPASDVRYVLVEQEETLHLFCNRKVMSPDTVLRIWPIFSPEEHMDHTSPFNAQSDAPSLSHTQHPDQKYIGPIFSSSSKQHLKTIIIAVMKRENGNTAELSRHFVPTPPIWHYDYAKQTIVNNSTQNNVVGRQEFPRLFQANVMAVLNGADLHRIEAIISGKKVGPVVIPAETLIKVNSRLDVLRATVIQELAEG